MVRVLQVAADLGDGEQVATCVVSRGRGPEVLSGGPPGRRLLPGAHGLVRTERLQPVHPRHDARRPVGERGARALLAGASGDVLEVGVGTGLNVPSYPPAVAAIASVGPEPSLHPLATRRAAARGMRVDHTEGDARRLPFDAGRFDTVVCTLVLCTVPEPGRAVRELARVLRPSGRLLFLEHVADRPGVRRVFQRVLNAPMRAVLCGCEVTRDTERTLAEHGFAFQGDRALRRRRHGLAPPVRHPRRRRARRRSLSARFRRRHPRPWTPCAPASSPASCPSPSASPQPRAPRTRSAASTSAAPTPSSSTTPRMVVLMRDGTRTVLSMQNNYQGPPEDFAMVVPVPVVLQKENVKTLPRERLRPHRPARRAAARRVLGAGPLRAARAGERAAMRPRRAPCARCARRTPVADGARRQDRGAVHRRRVRNRHPQREGLDRARHLAAEQELQDPRRRRARAPALRADRG